MIGARAALVAALLAAPAVAYTLSAQAQTAPVQAAGVIDVANALRPGVDAYRAGDLASAEAALRPLAAAGNADAMAWLGAVLIDRGAGSEGLQLLQKAVGSGSSEGAHQLGLAYAEGRGVTRDYGRALELLQKAATAGLRRAQLNLGTLYFRGQGTPRDLIQARAWLEKAASDNDPYALYALGRAMDDGQGTVPPDPVRAADLYRRAAEKGHPLAALRYGLALYDGNGIKRDPTTGQRWIVYANTNGAPEAALALGDIAVRLPAGRDKAANDKVVQTAISWYEAAARAGVASAQFKLANAYFAGAGVARDPVQAMQWYDRAARQGLPEAEHAMGVWLIGGLAGTSDPVEGYKWLILAEAGGHPDSRAVRQKMGEKISEADRQRAEALAASFTPVSERPLDGGVPRLGPPTSHP
jgi:uncharacterized protein